MVFQCCHKNRKFDLNKWGNRHWCDQTYCNVHGDYRYNVTRYSSTAVLHSVENTKNGDSPIVGEFMKEMMGWNEDLEDCQ